MKNQCFTGQVSEVCDLPRAAILDSDQHGSLPAEELLVLLDANPPAPQTQKPRFHCACGKNYKERKELLRHHRERCRMHEMCEEILKVATPQKTSSWEQQQLELRSILERYTATSSLTSTKNSLNTLSHNLSAESTCAVTEGTADLTTDRKSIGGKG